MILVRRGDHAEEKKPDFPAFQDAVEPPLKRQSWTGLNMQMRLSFIVLIYIESFQI